MLARLARFAGRFVGRDLPGHVRSAMLVDLQFQTSRTIVNLAMMTVGVQLCLHLGGTANHAAWIQAAQFYGMLATPMWVAMGRGTSPARLLIVGDAVAYGVLATLLALLWWDPGSATPTLFAWVLGTCGAVQSLGMPLFATVYGHIYPARHRGRIIGITRVFQGVITIAGIGAIGKLIEEHPHTAWLVYPLAALAALASSWRFSRLPLGDGAANAPRPKVLAAFGVLMRDRNFMRFELFFFIHGLANLAAMPALAVYVKEEMGLPIALAVLLVGMGVVEQATALASVPLHGRIFDRMGASWHRAATSAIIGLGFAIWAFAGDSFAIGVCAALLIGAGRGGGQIVFTIGALAFAPRGEEAAYNGAHVFLTGLRGVIGPLAGIWMLQDETLLNGDYRAYFLGCCAILMISAIGNWLFVKMPEKRIGDDPATG